MKFFGRSGGYYVFWAGMIYFWIGMFNIFVYTFTDNSILQILWIAALAFPFTYPPLGRWLNLDITWDQKMFNNWFNKKEETPSNVVSFPEAKPTPVLVPKPKEPEPQEHYRVGFDTAGRTTLTLMSYGSSLTLSMSPPACEHLIRMLRATYDDGDFTPDDPNGGEPVPVPEKEYKAA